MKTPRSPHEKRVIDGRRLGRLPNDPAKPRLRLATALATAPVVEAPADVDWLTRVESWPLYANDRLGDCGPAMAAHALMAVSTYGAGSEVTPTEDEVIDLYRRVSGYDPATGAHDDGVILQDMLNEWRTNGLAGHRIRMFAEVDVTDPGELQAALNLFGAVLVGADMPLDADQQFGAERAFDVTTGAGGKPGSWGGHAMHAARHSDTGDWRLVTWGDVAAATDEWWAKYVSEAWVVITDEWIGATGLTPAGLSMWALGEQFAALTGEPNPIPPTEPTAPNPPPAPSPVPAPEPTTPGPMPAPPPVPADGVLALLTEHSRERLAKGAERYGSVAAYAAHIIDRYFT